MAGMIDFAFDVSIVGRCVGNRLFKGIAELVRERTMGLDRKK